MTDLQSPTTTGTTRVKRGMADMLKGGVIMDVVTPEQAKIAEDAGAVAVMALERVPADIRAQGGIARMSDPDMIQGIIDAEHHVRASDGEVGDSEAVHHVAEVDDPADARTVIAGEVAGDEDVVVVEVVVDGVPGQPGEDGPNVGLELLDDRVDRAAELAVHERPMFVDDPARVGEIPVEVAMET